MRWQVTKYRGYHFNYYYNLPLKAVATATFSKQKSIATTVQEQTSVEYPSGAVCMVLMFQM